MSEVKRKKLSSDFFQQNFVGVYRLIFSYLPKNSQAYSLARCTKSLWNCFKGMLSVSSTRYHRLERLNEEEYGGLFAFDPFRPPGFTYYELPREVFCTTSDEYQERFFEEKFYKVLAAVNDAMGEKCFVSGSFALQNFFKDHLLAPRDEYLKFDVETARTKQTARKSTGGMAPRKQLATKASRKTPVPVMATQRLMQPLRRSSKNGYGFGRKGEQAHDIDIFILGDNKQEVVGLIMKEIAKQFTKPEEVIVKIIHGAGGLVNIFVKPDSPDRPAIMKKKKVTSTQNPVGRGYRYRHNRNLILPRAARRKLNNMFKSDDPKDKVLTFQLILKEVHNNPADVFSFFDLDCCKVGFFPLSSGIKVFSCIAFIRSILTGVNYLDLYLRKAGFKHLKRLCEYYHRTNIRTTCIPEPLLSAFHTFKGIVNYNKELIEWNGFKQPRGVIRTYGRHNFRPTFGEYYSDKDRLLRESYTEYSGDYNYGWGERYGTKHSPVFVPIDKLPRNDNNKYRAIYYDLETFNRKFARGKARAEIESLDFLPYICKSVGIFEDKDGRFKYEDRNFKEIVPDKNEIDSKPRNIRHLNAFRGVLQRNSRRGRIVPKKKTKPSQVIVIDD